MDHMMHLDQHHDNLQEERCGSNQQDAASASVSVSWVAFLLAAIAFLSLVSSFLGRGGAPSGAALPAASRQLLAALCGFATTKKALFIFSNAIFLFLAADCRCFFGLSTTTAPSESDDHHRTASDQLPSCAVQVVQLQPCGSCSGSLYHGSNATSASETCPREQGKREDIPVLPSTPESFRLEGASSSVNLETVVVLVQEPTCSGVDQELEKLELDELNRKFEEFIHSRRIRWIKEEEEAVHCQQV